MSMLSAQCDKLRELATRFDEIQVGATRAVRIPLDTGSVLREAADTIWELRDRAQDLQAHNAKLRKERDMYRDLVDCMVHPDIPDQLAAENAKLRELLRDAIYARDEADWASIVSTAIALGVEVEG